MSEGGKASVDGSGRPRISTGSAQLDEILGGGLPANSITILMGHPGTGKTILAEQLLFSNASEDRPAFYFTTLAEPLAKVVTYLQTLAFYDESKLGSAIVYEDAGAALATHGGGWLVTRIREAIKTMSPGLLVIDSFKVIHDLVHSPSEVRLLVSELAGLLSAYEVTTMLVGEYSEEQVPSYPEFAVADNILQLARMATSRRDERYLRVLKLRGSAYREGAHAFHITRAGLDVHPRLVTPHLPDSYVIQHERINTGIDGLDALLEGGFWRGSNTLILGAAGTGKTTLGLGFAAEGARQGEPTLYLNFQENPTQLARTIAGLGLDLPDLRQRGLMLSYSSPVELQIDSIVVDLFERVRGSGIRRVVIDALGELAMSPDPDRFHDSIYALVQHFSSHNITCLMTLEIADRRAAAQRHDAARLSSVSDGIILLGLDVSGPVPRRTIRIAKVRGTGHDLRPHELIIDPAGVRVGEPLTV